MTRVYLRPDAARIEENNGIGRVVHAQYRHLPKFDIELVGNVDRAQVVACHAHQHDAPQADVLMVHGLYWTGDVGSGVYDSWHTEANTKIIAAARRARVITVPSEWVAMPFMRDMRIKPVVIGHGIELDEWAPGRNEGYVLWNKNRGNKDVCNPRWAWALAEQGVQVMATFAPDRLARPASLTVTGALPHAQMKALVRDAHVYLATTKETFGIGTLEALACGVPVLGFDWGGTADLVRHEETGYLVRPGDVAGLLEGLDYIRRHRARLSAAAREFAQAYAWPKVIAQYAALYHELAASPETHGVAVVIPAHNYGRYLAECLESVLGQTQPVEEIVVVDDGSTDDTRAVAERYAARGVRLITQANQGVAAARNHGIAATRATYVVCLDADDLLAPRYVEACRQALVADRGLGIAYTGMQWLRPGSRSTENVWKGGFDWEWQATARVPPATTIPTGAMFRRALWERAGGYKQQYAPGEDAEFYTRGLSVGFTARQVTDSPWFIYRDHGGGAHKVRPYVPIDDAMPWMRDRHYPLAAPADQAPPVRSYSEPRVSVIIPVGPGHGRYLPAALDSLLGQSVRDWEAIVVDDSAGTLPAVLGPYPFVKRAASGGRGAGAARNAGLVLAGAPLVLFLDADDTLEPDALKVLCQAYSEGEGRYVYGDWREVGPAGGRVHESPAYDRIDWLDFDGIATGHVVSVLMATADALAVGGFDDALTAWEDWDFFIKCRLAGVQGKRAPFVTLNVRRGPGSRTERAFADRRHLLRVLKDRYGGRKMAEKKCCGGNGDAIMAAKLAFQQAPEAGRLSVRRTAVGRGSTPRLENPSGVEVRMKFIGQRQGAVTFAGAPGSGRTYRGGNNTVDRYKNVHPDDVAALERTGFWQQVGVPAAELAAPAAEPRADQVGPVTELEPAREPVTSDDPGTGPLVLEETAPVEPPLEKPGQAAVEKAKPIQTADGTVARKRVRQGGKNTPLKDLPGQ